MLHVGRSELAGSSERLDCSKRQQAADRGSQSFAVGNIAPPNNKIGRSYVGCSECDEVTVNVMIIMRTMMILINNNNVWHKNAAGLLANILSTARPCNFRERRTCVWNSSLLSPGPSSQEVHSKCSLNE